MASSKYDKRDALTVYLTCLLQEDKKPIKILLMTSFNEYVLDNVTIFGVHCKKDNTLCLHHSNERELLALEPFQKLERGYTPTIIVIEDKYIDFTEKKSVEFIQEFVAPFLIMTDLLFMVYCSATSDLITGEEFLQRYKEETKV